MKHLYQYPILAALVVVSCPLRPAFLKFVLLLILTTISLPFRPQCLKFVLLLTLTTLSLPLRLVDGFFGLSAESFEQILAREAAKASKPPKPSARPSIVKTPKPANPFLLQDIAFYCAWPFFAVLISLWQAIEITLKLAAPTVVLFVLLSLTPFAPLAILLIPVAIVLNFFGNLFMCDTGNFEGPPIFYNEDHH